MAHLSSVEAFAAGVRLCSSPTSPPAPAACKAATPMRRCSAADYVMFGARPARAALFAHPLERLSWWAELFEIACVGYAASRDEIAPIAKTGADFIALGEWIWTEPHNTAARSPPPRKPSPRRPRRDARVRFHRSSPRKRGPSGFPAASIGPLWIPACAGMSGETERARHGAAGAARVCAAAAIAAAVLCGSVHIHSPSAMKSAPVLAIGAISSRLAA